MKLLPNYTLRFDETETHSYLCIDGRIVARVLFAFVIVELTPEKENFSRLMLLSLN